MKTFLQERFKKPQAGMELVQVAIIIAIAIVIGIIFKDNIKTFIDDVFSNLSVGKFK